MEVESFCYRKWKSQYHSLGKDKLLSISRSSSADLSASCYDWDDMVFRYREEPDEFRLFFIRTPKEKIKRYQNITSNVRAARDIDEKIRFIEFQKASTTFGCHLLDYAEKIEGWPACSLHWQYDVFQDALSIHFMSQDDVKRRFNHQLCIKKPHQMRIVFSMDKNDRFLSIKILGASKLLCKKIIEENTKMEKKQQKLLRKDVTIKQPKKYETKLKHTPSDEQVIMTEQTSYPSWYLPPEQFSKMSKKERVDFFHTQSHNSPLRPWEKDLTEEKIQIRRDKAKDMRKKYKKTGELILIHHIDGTQTIL